VTPRERRALWWMAAPFLAGVAILVAGPALLTFAMAFCSWDLVRPPTFVGLDNFRELAADPGFRRALGSSLAFVAIAVPLRLVVALGLAMLLHARAGRVTPAARSAALWPSVIPEAAVAIVWLWLLNPLFGPVNLALGALGLPTPPWLTDPTAARAAVILMSLFVVADGVVIAVAARRAIPRDLEDLAASEGAGPWSRFVRVTLPLMAPALLLIVARDTVASVQVTFVPALLVFDGGPPPDATTYLPFFVYREGFEYLRYGYASAATMALYALTAAALWLELRAVDGLRRGGLLGRALSG
jgi:multiple sugar transport system permease protein